jgi:hypothetical protein
MLKQILLVMVLITPICHAETPAEKEGKAAAKETVIRNIEQTVALAKTACSLKSDKTAQDPVSCAVAVDVLSTYKFKNI